MTEKPNVDYEYFWTNKHYDTFKFRIRIYYGSEYIVVLVVEENGEETLREAIRYIAGELLSTFLADEDTKWFIYDQDNVASVIFQYSSPQSNEEEHCMDMGEPQFFVITNDEFKETLRYRH